MTWKLVLEVEQQLLRVTLLLHLCLDLSYGGHRCLFFKFNQENIQVCSVDNQLDAEGDP